MTPHRPDALAEVGGAGSRQHGARVVRHPEMNPRVRQRELRESAKARGELRRGRLEELEPGRSVEEQVANLDARPGIGGYREALLDRAAFAGQTQAFGRPARSAREGEAGDGADRREGLTPEAERHDRVEIFVTLELGGRVTLERQR